MKKLYDFHIHSKYSDGENSLEGIVRLAILKKISIIGFTDHSYTFFDESYCMKKDDIAKYQEEISKLKEKYKERIKILCGIEQDYYSDESTENYDYVIGSVHYIKIGNDYIPIDDPSPSIKETANKYFDGDVYKVIEKYYECVADIINKTNCDFIGHFDIIAQRNSNNVFFDESDERYRKIWQPVVDKLIKLNKPFEINTRPILKKIKKEPCPSNAIRKYIKENGGKFILCSDTHNKKDLCYHFQDYIGEVDGKNNKRIIRW